MNTELEAMHSPEPVAAQLLTVVGMPAADIVPVMQLQLESTEQVLCLVCIDKELPYTVIASAAVMKAVRISSIICQEKVNTTSTGEKNLNITTFSQWIEIRSNVVLKANGSGGAFYTISMRVHIIVVDEGVNIGEKPASDNAQCRQKEPIYWI